MVIEAVDAAVTKTAMLRPERPIHVAGVAPFSFHFYSANFHLDRLGGFWRDAGVPYVAGNNARIADTHTSSQKNVQEYKGTEEEFIDPMVGHQ